MSRFLIQLNYTPAAWAAMLKEPQNRLEKVSAAVEKLGGKIIDGYYTYGDYDLVSIFEMPDNVAAAAACMAFSAGGAIKDLKCTPLIPMSDALTAMSKGAGMGYKTPGEK